MSSRARVVGDLARVERFDWGSASEQAAAPSGGPPTDRLRIVEPLPEAAPPEAPPAEHQARLAALEREAFAKGYAQGERAGLEAGAKRADAMLRRVAQTIEDLGALRKAIVRDTERQLVELSLTVARRVIMREVSLDPTLVAAVAHVALERLGDVTPATIRLNPEDHAIVTAQGSARWAGAQVTLLPDPGLARGGCVVECAFGTVDGSIDAQLDEMARALLGGGAAPAEGQLPDGE